MVRHLAGFLFTIVIFSSAQNRMLIHIGANGQQEAIPLSPRDRAEDVIARIENSKAALINKTSSASGIIDSLKHYPGDANSDAVLTTNFGWTHQDVAFQWYVPAASGIVEEVWWRNHSLQGGIKKATVRGWMVNPKVTTLPANVASKHLGYYKDITDGDGLVTPFKPATGDQWFYGNGLSDSSTWNFDPLGTEASWLQGGLQVSLDSGKWQGIKLKDWGDPMIVKIGEPFGFTISNDTKVSVSGDDPRLEILSWANANPAPYHSYKFYEMGRTGATDKGWHLRGDYDWGMYVVVSYISGCTPRITLSNFVNTTIKSTPREICFSVRSCDTTAFVCLKYKVGSGSIYDSLIYNNVYDNITYCATLPAAFPGDTVYWLITATDVKGNRTMFGPRTYVLFKKNQANLFIYNNAMFSLGNNGANLVYNSASTILDRWSAPTDGISELDDLLSLYDNVIVADGNFPSRNIYPALKKWFEKGTPTAKKNLFFTSQDFGCYITNTCKDTIFSPGTLEYDFLGIEKLGPQDLGPINRPYQLVPQSDPATNYLIKYNTDSATTLWHHPTFELSTTYSAYPDGMTPKAEAKSLFKDGEGVNTLGVLTQGATFNSMFVAFDAGALQFRSDTSKSPQTDPKYQWIVDIGALSTEFFKSYTGINEPHEGVPSQYKLVQNYPNPFNPNTTIEFVLPHKENVQITIYNILGQKIETLINETLESGSHTVQWNAQPYASGLYFYEMRSGTFADVKKMMLMK